MDFVDKLDEHGKGAWIGVMILSFILFWPAGLAILAYLIWSGRMRYWKRGGPGRWHNNHGCGAHNGKRRRRGSSGNSAFDEYREETLKRLEDEQIEFESYLERLRQAKDKTEFDQFMEERRNRPKPGPTIDGDEPQPSA